ncbi:hypothetical protein SDC9_120151 [bioreactor metagenome]|uniref:Uncharacterized protein n=1 Tax=bioreactor metagenome TaxID=1076179 RepID=A0A645C6H5_9ZZZZ
MAVGPSAAPMMPIEAASLMSNPKNTATAIVKKIPNWAAAPNNSMNGFCRSGPKSIMAPMPIKINNGNSSVLIPASKRTSRTPSDSLPLTICVRTPVPGKLTRIVPNPIGTNKVGSYSFLIPRYISTLPMTIMISWPGVTDKIPATICSNFYFPPNVVFIE